MSKWAVLATIVVIAGCGGTNTYVEPPPAEVTVTKPVRRKVVDYMEFTGMTKPVETVEIRARVKGFLKERHFQDGAEVKAGQLLLVIDEEPFQVALEAANTKLQEAEAAYQQATGGKTREVARAQLALSQTQLLWAKQEESRSKTLSDRKVNTQAEVEENAATAKMKEAEVESSKANLDHVLAMHETAILTAKAQVASAKAAVRSATLDLSYCRMAAPVSGRISHIQVDVGNLVGDGTASVLATVVKMDPMYVYATVSETDILRTPLLVRHGRTDSAPQPQVPVDLGLASRKDYPYQGMIDYTDPSVDPGTGTLRLRALFQNTDRSLMPGMFVRMRVAVDERPDAMLVPERALGTDQSGQYVLVVDKENKVQYRPVTVGAAVDDLHVVEGKIALTDQIIVEGLLRARPGAIVKPMSANAPAAVSTASKTKT